MKATELAVFFETLTGMNLLETVKAIANNTRFAWSKKKTRHFRKYTKMYQRGAKRN